MEFDDYDKIWEDLESVGKKYGYQLEILYNDSKTADNPDDVIRATFVKENKE